MTSNNAEDEEMEIVQDGAETLSIKDEVIVEDESSSISEESGGVNSSGKSSGNEGESSGRRKSTSSIQSSERDTPLWFPKADQRVLNDAPKFMENFNPENSSRNQQKKKRRYNPLDGRLMLYAQDFEDCDCLRPDCTGCHFPCKNCGDRRCGHECRNDRKWLYETVEVEGKNIEYKNPHTQTQFV